MIQRIKSTATATFIYSLGNLSVKLTDFILLPLYTSTLSTAEFGILGTLEVTSQMLVAILGISLPTAMLRWCSSEKTQADVQSVVFTTFSSILAILIAFNLVMFPFSAGFSQLVLESPDYSRYFNLLFLSLSFDLLNLVVLNLIRFHEKPFFYIMLNAVKLSVILGLNIYFLQVLKMGIEGIILGQLIGSALLSIFSLPFVFKNSNFHFSWPVFKAMSKYGFPLIFTTISALLLSMGDRFIIPRLLSLSDLGVYTLGYKMGGIINMFILQSFQLGFLPIAYKMYEEKDAKRFFSKVLTYFSILLVVAALGLSMFSKEIIILFSKSNSDYWAAFVVVPLISFSFVIKGWQYYFSLGLHYVKRTSYNAWIVMGCAALSLGLNFLLIPAFGIVGAAITMILANAVMAVLFYIVSQRFYRINFELTRILKMTVTGLVIYGLSFFVSESNFWLGIVVKALLFAAFPVMLYFLKFFDPAELMHIRQFVNSMKGRLLFKQNNS